MEDKKVLLSIKDLQVKFRVRGRILTAIRGVTLDIYENESIAIVGESGAGKSVFTKAFAGMLDSNGFIDQGDIIFNDAELSDTVVPLNSYAKKTIASTWEKLNEYSKLEYGSEVFLKMKALEQEKEEKMTLSEEEREKADAEIKELVIKRTELFNYKQTLDTSKEKAKIKETSAEISRLDGEIKALQKAKEEKIKAHKQAAMNDTAYNQAYDAKMAEYKKEDAGLQGLATLYPETVQIVTLKKSGIKSVADFKGKRIAVGAAGSGTEANARQIMEAYGIKYDDIKVQYLSFGEAASALKDGNVDAAFVTAGHPTAAIQDIATQNDVVLVPVDADKADALIKQYPFYTKLVIKAGTYPKQDADVTAVAVKCMLAVTDKMDENTAYAIAKALYGNLDRMKSAHSAANAISKDTAKDGMSIKLNPGAEKFFNEK